MKDKPNLFQRVAKPAFVSTFAAVLTGASAIPLHAATWLNNGTSDWNTATNWNPTGVPNGAAAVIITNTGQIATISANPTSNPGDVIVGSGSGTNGLLVHTGGTYTTGSWVKIGHNSGSGVYNLAGTGTGGTFTGLSQGTGGFTISGGGNLRVGGGDAGSGGQGTLNVNTSGSISVGGNLYVGTQTSTGTINLDNGTITGHSEVVIGNGAVGGSGVTGTLNMSGGTFTKTTSTTSNFLVGSAGATGNLNMTGGTLNNNREFWIGNGSGSNGNVTLGGSAILNTNSWFSIGRSGGTGTVTVNGGTLNKNNSDSAFIVGDGSTGTLNQSNGAIVAAGESWVGNGSSTANYNMSGGTFTSNSWFVVGRGAGSNGTITMTGGTINKTTAGSDFVVGAESSTASGTVLLSGGLINATGANASVGKNAGTGLLTLSNTGEFQTNTMTVGDGAAGTNGTINLNGGTLTVTTLAGGNGTSTVNFNGGTLKARADNATFMQGLTTARVRDGGVTVDTGAFNVTTAQTILRSGSFGDAGTGVLRKIGSGTLTLSGSGDNAGLRVRVEAGTLVLAKATSTSVHAVGTGGGSDYALEITGGTARLGGTGGDQIYINSAVRMTGGTFDLAGLSEGFDGLSGTGGTITNSVSSTTSTLTLGQNHSAGSPVFNGGIQNGSGTLALVKTGSGTQTLGGANSYSGGTTISGGTLAVAHNNALGTGTVTLGNGTTLANFNTSAHTLANNIAFASVTGMAATLWANSDLTLNGGLSGGSNGIQIAVRGPGTVTISNNGHNLGSNAAPAIWTVTDGGTLALTQGNNLGNLPSSPTSQVILDNGTFKTITANSPFFSSRGLQVNAAGGTWLDSAGGVSFDGAVQNNGPFTVNTAVANATTYLNGAVNGTGSLTKTGAGTLVLSATSGYTGETTVSAGKLVVNGNISTSITTRVTNTGTLGGSGTLGALVVETGGTVSPGNSPGILQTGDFELQTGGTLFMELNGITPGSGYDQLQVTGSVSLAGMLDLSLGFTPTNGDLFFILLNDSNDAVNGTFSGLADNSEFTSGDQSFRISYFGNSATNSFIGGNDVVLMAVPEPGAALIGSLGLLALLRRRR